MNEDHSFRNQGKEENEEKWVDGWEKASRQYTLARRDYFARAVQHIPSKFASTPPPPPPPPPPLNQTRMFWDAPRPPGYEDPSNECTHDLEMADADTANTMEIDTTAMEMEGTTEMSIPTTRHPTNVPVLETTTASRIVSPPAMEENPFRGVPTPQKFEGSPRQVLMNYYSKGRRCETSCGLTDDSFFSWHDDGPPHELKYMCIFVCPVTYERFTTGKFTAIHTAELLGKKDEMGVVWHLKKKNAMHGAAARAYDCFYYRDCLDMNNHQREVALRKAKIHGALGDETPYATEEQDYIVDIPSEIESKIQDQIKTWEQEKKKLEEDQIAKKRKLEEDQKTKEEEDQEEDQSRTIYKKSRVIIHPPRQILMNYYGTGKRCETSCGLTDASFFDWDNDGSQNELKYMCIFVCPVTYERFATGRYMAIRTNGIIGETGDRGVVWHSKKKNAIHGAAARAYDCFNYRKCLDENNHEKDQALRIARDHALGPEIPYDVNEEHDEIFDIPYDIEENIQAQIRKWENEKKIKLEEDK